MIGVHDLGGMHHLGPVATGDDEAFHEDWERLTFGLQMLGAAVGDWTADEYRHLIELMPPAEYLQTPYFTHWLTALEALYSSRGFVTREEIRTRQEALRNGAPLPPPPAADSQVAEHLISTMRRIAFEGGGVRRPEVPSSFSVGDRVRAKTLAVPGHTRAPRYIWGRTGTVVSYSGVYSLPDTVAHHRGENPEPVFGVRFDGQELWGPDAEPGTSVTVDLWESYMEPLGHLQTEPTS
ncbi:nitrile hydratase subunit beta [Arthrobacter zhaoguopingii]|uniref:nitrile hydratase subunit beta n=1 Tax=Arthrobacter zhaoguopingii TaxID=2681491 RepID=UPI0013592C7F|nr:nitrile hydratase subunit beta [Arthrobacter zhaoguopingii]